MDRKKLSFLVFLIFCIAFAGIVWEGLSSPQLSDENVYIYGGKLVTQGDLPYRDFFLAHPPLQEYALALLHWIFGYQVLIFKLLPLLSTLGTAFLVFRIAQERFGNTEALVSALLFLFSYSIMFDSVLALGVQSAMFLLMAGVYLLFVKRSPFWAGIFFGLAGITRVLSLVPIAVILALLFFDERKRSMHAVAGFLSVFLTVNVVFAVLSRGAFLGDVYAFHLMRTPDAGEGLAEYLNVLGLNWILFASSLLFLVSKKKGVIMIFAAVSAAYLVFLLLLKNLFAYYLLLAFPFLAVIAGRALAGVLRSFKLEKKWKFVIVAVLLGIFSWDLFANVMFLESVGFAGYTRAHDVADYVASLSGEDTVLYGDGSLTPLIALMTGIPIAGNHVDTNRQVFLSGAREIEEDLSELEGRDVIFLARANAGITSFPEAREFLNTKCDFWSQFSDPLEGAQLVYRC